MRILLTVVAALSAACPALLQGGPFYPGSYVQVQTDGVNVQVNAPYTPPGVYGGVYAPGVVTHTTYRARPLRGLLGLLGRGLTRSYSRTTVYVATPPPVLAMPQSQIPLPPAQTPRLATLPVIAATPPADGSHPVLGATPAPPLTPFAAAPGLKKAKPALPVGEMNPSVAPAGPLDLTGGLEDLPRTVAKPAPFDPVVAKAGQPTPPKTPMPAQAAPTPAAISERAKNLLEQGDKLFAAQRFHEAGQRYKSAIAAAPQHGGAYFRRAIALIATNRYDLAAPLARRGATLDPQFVRSGFRLNQLYDGANLAKNAHLDALARTALEHDRDATNWFLVGMMLHFDGQGERAQSFFRKAMQLETGDTTHITPFLRADTGPTGTSGARSVLQPAG